MKHLTVLSLLASIFVSCSGEQTKPESVNNPKLEIGTDTHQSDASVGEPDNDKAASKMYNGVKYTIDLINAVDFVSRQGEKLELSERMELSRESVVILKIDLQNIKETSVFESAKITMNKEDALQYLVGQISNDFSIEQNGESKSPTGVQYDAGISEPDNIKVFLFFNNINLNKPSSALYYDRLFGAGLMRFKINNGK
jgi:hypothetical protein